MCKALKVLRLANSILRLFVVLFAIRANLESIPKFNVELQASHELPPAEVRIFINVALIILNQNFTLMPHYQCKNQDSDHKQ
jgi:hypothetical protein